MSKVSIIIPCFNEEKYINSCITSVINSDLKNYEVIFIDGGSEDKTLEIIKKYQQNYSFLKLLHNPKKIAPAAMNIGIKEAKGEYIIRIDAHAVYPEDYFSKLIKWHKKLDADNVGAVLETKVKNETTKSNSIKEVLSHRLGVGNSIFRISTNKLMQVDTVPFGCYKKEIFQKYGFYNENLVRNQDIEFNKRIINGGGKIYLVPDIICTYFARENFKDLAENNFANGQWNILTAYYTKTFKSLSLRHFIPLVFILSLFIPVILYPFFPALINIAFISLLSYSVLVIIISLKLKNSKNSFFYLLTSFFVLHFSYGLGSLVGIYKIIKKGIVNATYR